jgi:hypothetical protein
MCVSQKYINAKHVRLTMSMSYITLGLYVCIRICIKRGDSLAKTNNAKKKRGEGGQKAARNAACCEVRAPYTNRGWIHEEPACFEWKNSPKCKVLAPHTNRGWIHEEPACFEWKNAQKCKVLAPYTLTEVEFTKSPHVLREKTHQNVRCSHHTLTEVEFTKSPHVLSEKTRQNVRCTHH